VVLVDLFVFPNHMSSDSAFSLTVTQPFEPQSYSPAVTSQVPYINTLLPVDLQCVIVAAFFLLGQSTNCKFLANGTQRIPKEMEPTRFLF
jgi:hypothetical protein